jgi:hypothetical protein
MSGRNVPDLVAMETLSVYVGQDVYPGLLSMNREPIFKWIANA